MSAPVVRLLKVTVQPVFVVIDGEDVTEANVQPIVMPAAEWRALDPTEWADLGAAAVSQHLAKADPDG